MLQRLLGKGAAISRYAVQPKPPTTTIIISSSSPKGGGGGGGGGGCGGDGGYQSFFSTSLPRSAPSSSDSPLLIALFQSYGIREEDTNVILGKIPKFRSYNVENILRPKLDFLRSVGLTGADISQILGANPYFLAYKLDNCISKTINFLKTILPSKDALIRILKRGANSTHIEPNIEVLKHRGVPETWILKMLLNYPMALARSQEHFLATAGHVEDLGLSPDDGGSYVRALGVMSYMSRPTFLRKVDMYKQLGWSEDQVVKLIRTQPACLGMSEKDFRRKMEFFEKRIGWGVDHLSLNPFLLNYSLDKRIIPRCAVLNILLSRGLLPKKGITPSTTFLQINNKRFFDKYVLRFHEEIPDVVLAFRGHIDFHGWEWLKKKNDCDTNNKEEEEKSSDTRN